MRLLLLKANELHVGFTWKRLFYIGKAFPINHPKTVWVRNAVFRATLMCLSSGLVCGGLWEGIDVQVPLLDNLFEIPQRLA